MLLAIKITQEDGNNNSVYLEYDQKHDKYTYLGATKPANRYTSYTSIMYLGVVEDDLMLRSNTPWAVGNMINAYTLGLGFYKNEKPERLPALFKTAKHCISALPLSICKYDQSLVHVLLLELETTSVLNTQDLPCSSIDREHSFFGRVVTWSQGEFTRYSTYTAFSIKDTCFSAFLHTTKLPKRDYIRYLVKRTKPETIGDIQRYIEAKESEEDTERLLQYEGTLADEAIDLLIKGLVYYEQDLDHNIIAFDTQRTKNEVGGLKVEYLDLKDVKNLPMTEHSQRFNTSAFEKIYMCLDNWKHLDIYNLLKLQRELVVTMTVDEARQRTNSIAKELAKREKGALWFLNRVGLSKELHQMLIYPEFGINIALICEEHNNQAEIDEALRVLKYANVEVVNTPVQTSILTVGMLIGDENEWER